MIMILTIDVETACKFMLVVRVDELLRVGVVIGVVVMFGGCRLGSALDLGISIICL